MVNPLVSLLCTIESLLSILYPHTESSIPLACNSEGRVGDYVYIVPSENCDMLIFDKLDGHDVDVRSRA